MYCVKCGHQNQDNAKFCSRCGNAMTQKPQAIQQTPQQRPIAPQQPVQQGPVAPQQPVQQQQGPATPYQATPPYQGAPQKNPFSFPKKAPKLESDKKPSKFSPEKIFTKDNAINAALWVFLAGVYVCISLIFIYIFNMSNTITVSSAYNDEFVKNLTLQEFLKLLSEGNRIFNPTVFSKTISLAISIFFYSVPAFAGLALIVSIFSKNNMKFNITSAIVSFLSSLMLVGVVPLSIMLVPQIHAALGVRLGLMADDISKITYTPLIIHAAAVMVFIVIALVVVKIYNRRRYHA